MVKRQKKQVEFIKTCSELGILARKMKKQFEELLELTLVKLFFGHEDIIEWLLDRIKDNPIEITPLIYQNHEGDIQLYAKLKGYNISPVQQFYFKGKLIVAPTRDYLDLEKEISEGNYHSLIETGINRIEFGELRVYEKNVHTTKLLKPITGERPIYPKGCFEKIRSELKINLVPILEDVANVLNFHKLELSKHELLRAPL